MRNPTEKASHNPEEVHEASQGTPASDQRAPNRFRTFLPIGYRRNPPAFRLVFILLVFFYFSPCDLSARPIIAASAGMDADIALHEKTAWFATVQAPVIWADQRTIGLALVPAFSFNSSDFHGFLTIEGIINLPLGHGGETRLLLHSGLGAGGYHHSDRTEFLPHFSCGMSLLQRRFLIRLSADTMVMNKYYRNIDTYISMTLGFAI